MFWSAHEALLVVLAIDTRETYRFLNSAIDSSVTRRAFEARLAVSHSNSTNRRTDLVLQSSWRAASAMVLVSPWARARSSCAKRWNPLIRHQQPCNRSVDVANDGQLSRQHGSHDVCLGLDGTIPSARNDCETDVPGQRQIGGVHRRCEPLQFLNEGFNVQLMKPRFRSELVVHLEIATGFQVFQQAAGDSDHCSSLSQPIDLARGRHRFIHPSLGCPVLGHLLA